LSIETRDKGSGYSWQEAFGTDDKQTVENICRKFRAEFEWKAFEKATPNLNVASESLVRSISKASAFDTPVSVVLVY
jgi:hypothetical protein